jgi:hypothetical protein
VTQFDAPSSDGRPLPVPGQRVSGIAFPPEYVLPGKPDASAPPAAHDAYRQTGFVLASDLRLFSDGMNLQLRILNDSSHSRYRTHVYAAVTGTWSRGFAALADAALLATRGSYSSVPNLVRSACELIAAEHQLHREEMGEFVGWMLAHLKPDEEHKAFDVGLGHYFAGTTLAADEGLRVVYRSASDLGRPNFGATLLEVGPESNNQRLAYAFAEASFHVAWAEIEVGWLLRLCERQVAVAVHMPDVFNITPEAHDAYAAYARDVQSRLDDPDRARMEEIEQGGFKRWLIHNFRRQPSGAPKKVLL